MILNRLKIVPKIEIHSSNNNITLSSFSTTIYFFKSYIRSSKHFHTTNVGKNTIDEWYNGWDHIPWSTCKNAKRQNCLDYMQKGKKNKSRCLADRINQRSFLKRQIFNPKLNSANRAAILSHPTLRNNDVPVKCELYSDDIIKMDKSISSSTSTTLNYLEKLLKGICTLSQSMIIKHNEFAKTVQFHQHLLHISEINYSTKLLPVWVSITDKEQLLHYTKWKFWLSHQVNHPYGLLIKQNQDNLRLEHQLVGQIYFSTEVLINCWTNEDNLPIPMIVYWY